jgi:hypothetical protein
MVFLQVMGILFCVLLLIRLMAGCVKLVEMYGTIVERLDSHTDSINILCERTSHLKLDIDQVLVRLKTLESETIGRTRRGS